MKRMPRPSTLGKPVETLVHKKLTETVFLIVHIKDRKRILENVAKYTGQIGIAAFDDERGTPDSCRLKPWL